MSIERVAVPNQVMPVAREATVRQSFLSKIASLFKREAPAVARDIATGEAQRKLNPFSTELPPDSPQKVSEPSKP